jgi:putative hydrolase of HD superfamily
MEKLTLLLHEIGMLAKTPRSGLPFMGSGSQSVAEHSHRMSCLALLLAERVPETIDRLKLVSLCLFHDIAEARTGDLNYVHQHYVDVNENGALEDLRKAYGSFGEQIVAFCKEFNTGTSIEAKLARDADQLESLLVFKQEADTGNPCAAEWLKHNAKRLQTDIGRELAQAIAEQPFDAWWRQIPGQVR